MTPKPLPYGAWPTPITSELVVAGSRSPAEVRVSGDEVWWSELRPEEGGRYQLVRRAADGTASEVLPEGWNARTAAHEYGGGAWFVSDDSVWFSDWRSQRLHRLDPGGRLEPVSPEPDQPRGDRWADGALATDGSITIVREHHPVGGGPGDVVNEVVRLHPGGGEPEVLVTGPDFVASPRWSPDGQALCWVEWDHPDMPWDSTRLVVRGAGGDQLVAGGPGESVVQPRWLADGSLGFISDRGGWWHLCRWSPAGGVEPMLQVEGELQAAQWVFGLSAWCQLDDGRVVAVVFRDGVERLVVRLADGPVHDLDVPHTSLDSLQALGDGVVYIGASFTREPEVVRVTLDGARVASLESLSQGRELGVAESWFSVPEHVTFPTADGTAVAHALVYPPTNPECSAPEDERPPLLVVIHGGPTSAARPMLRLGTQYWTSRGFCVADVNYRGSTGYGRAFRDLLRDAWGIADVQDCVAAAAFLADRGDVDGERLCIRGGSAGGYTTLAALAFHDGFTAGASHFGVADLEALATETHKFESRYLDGLIGPYPEARDVYVARSPIHHVDGIDRPLAVFQGLEDEVVPPNQSEMIVAALRAKGVPVAYVAFEGEQHGFRQAANIRRSLDGELSFYAQVLGFDLPPEEGIDPVEIIPPPI